LMQEMKIVFKSPTQLVIENGVSAKLGMYLKKLNVTKALLVTDSVILGLGVIEKMEEEAKAYGVSFAVYSDVLPEPPEENVTAALQVYKDNGCDGVVGIGGGSAIDVAKAAAMLVTNGGSYADYTGIDKVPN